MTSTVFAKIQMRRGTAAEWLAASPILAQGEMAFETDTGITKIGDGATSYLSLPAYATYDQMLAAQQAIEAAQLQVEEFETSKLAAEAAATAAVAKAAEAASDASTAASAAEMAELRASEASQSEINAASSAAQAAASEGAAADSADASAQSAAAAASSAALAAGKSLEASQFRDEASDAAAAASTAADRVSLGELDEAVASAEADATAAAASASASAASAAQSEVSRVHADASASAARSARDAAFVNANVFADIATGRAAVSDGQQFQVATGDEIIRYRRGSSSTQTEVARYPAGQAVVALDGALGQLAAILGQVYEEVDRLSAAQEGDVYTLRTLLEMISVVGQLADQINGGQVALKGGTLADPALRIGTVGVYSSAANTLSIAIAGTEVARFTAAGLTVYGTVTEA